MGGVRSTIERVMHNHRARRKLPLGAAQKADRIRLAEEELRIQDAGGIRYDTIRVMVWAAIARGFKSPNNILNRQTILLRIQGLGNSEFSNR